MALVYRRVATAIFQGSFFVGCFPTDVAQLCVGVCIMLKVSSRPSMSAMPAFSLLT